MSKEELKEILKDNLSISINHNREDCDCIIIEVYFDDEIIAKDYC